MCCLVRLIRCPVVFKPQGNLEGPLNYGGSVSNSLRGYKDLFKPFTKIVYLLQQIYDIYQHFR